MHGMTLLQPCLWPALPARLHLTSAGKGNEDDRPALLEACDFSLNELPSRNLTPERSVAKVTPFTQSKPSNGNSARKPATLGLHTSILQAISKPNTQNMPRSHLRQPSREERDGLRSTVVKRYINDRITAAVIVQGLREDGYHVT